MNLQPGTFLQNAPGLDDPNFNDAMLFITEHNANGAVGFVINRLFNRALNELEEFSQSIAFPLYEGGPVDKEHLYFIHRRPDRIEGGSPVAGNLYFGGNFQQAVSSINKGTVNQQDIKIFIGYCGWDAGELEAEIAEGGWLLVENELSLVFAPPATS
ncbi:YqgE/AlgH family protein [Foetidibacter luteolus]|uniref:YqgE/AlgH family protein n=1 Tax=Foetidibacter luteolus TaxID=2608880 RepID=UPI00129B90D2|nr:YqgE/AlgH family protein [Foetidibacter luteolus]